MTRHNARLIQLRHPNRRLALHLDEPAAAEVDVKAVDMEISIYGFIHKQRRLSWNRGDSTGKRNKGEYGLHGGYEQERATSRQPELAARGRVGAHVTRVASDVRISGRLWRSTATTMSKGAANVKAQVVVRPVPSFKPVAL